MPALLFDTETDHFPERARRFPQMRYMGSKHRLLPWLWEVMSGLEFDTVLDTCAGSGCVSYLLKAMGKEVTGADFLHFSSVILKASVENSRQRLTTTDVDTILEFDPRHKRFVETTFEGVFFTRDDLRFLDRASWNISKLTNAHKRSIALAALIRSCAKRQPRGVFTVAGDPERYKDGRRDVRLAIREHFLEQVNVFNQCVFDNGRDNRAICADLFAMDPEGFDLVYIDPPYVPRADDNCYVKRYHFLEGLSRYWEGVEVMMESRVRKIRKPFTPFSYRRTAPDAFHKMFERFAASMIVLSYSSNGFPSLETLIGYLRRFKPNVTVHERSHRYHFGTHSNAQRNLVTEYLIVGRS